MLLKLNILFNIIFSSILFFINFTIFIVLLIKSVSENIILTNIRDESKSLERVLTSKYYYSLKTYIVW